jgi:competence protein ComEC
MFLWLLGVLIGAWLFIQPLETKIVFCDVGQGDGILLTSGWNQILIDGGPDESILSCLHRHLPLGDQTIEMVVVSHPDTDHLTGLNAVFDTFKVKNLLISEIPKDTWEWYHFYERVWQQQALKILTPVLAQKWCLQSKLCCQTLTATAKIQTENIWQKKITITEISGLLTENLLKNYNYNNGSIVLKCEVEEKNVLLTGDIDQATELALIAQSLLTKVDILKVAHHGSKTSSSSIFLEILQPEDSVIMCGQANSYGHPHQLTLNNLQRVGSRIWRTDLQGEIIFKRLTPDNWQIKTHL